MPPLCQRELVDEVALLCCSSSSRRWLLHQLFTCISVLKRKKKMLINATQLSYKWKPTITSLIRPLSPALCVAVCKICTRHVSTVYISKVVLPNWSHFSALSQPESRADINYAVCNIETLQTADWSEKILAPQQCDNISAAATLKYCTRHTSSSSEVIATLPYNL